VHGVCLPVVRVRGLGAALLIVLSLVAVGGGPVTLAQPAAATCGEVPSIAPQDPDGVLSSLPANLAGWYNGYEVPVYQSQWANWHPNHSAPYTVGLAFGPIVNPFQQAIYDGIQAALKQSPMVGNVIALATPGGGAIAQDVQNYNSLVQQGVDLIIAEPNSTASLADSIQAAADQGIPTIMWINSLDSRYAVNVSGNQWLGGESVAQAIKQLGGKGNVLGVHGIPSTDVDNFSFDMFHQMIGACPAMAWAGDVVGNFTPPVVQSEVLKFLATHPQKIDVVVQTGVMAPSIIQAFIQAGRPVPMVLDEGAQVGSLAYWGQNMPNGYVTTGTVTGDNQWVDLASRVALRMLAGQGLRINTVVIVPVTLSDANVSEYVDPSWTLDTPGTVEAKPADLPTDALLDTFFTNPRPLS
jgi:ribose transport system substrate-binding protein